MDKVFPDMTSDQIKEITPVLVAYLKEAIFQKHDSACQKNIGDDTAWLSINFGDFSKYINYSDLMDFNITGEISILSQTQLAQLVAIPGELKQPDDISKIMAMINFSFLGPFFDIVSPVIQENEGNYSQEIKSTLLQVVFERGNLSSPSVSDNEILLWLKFRLRPLLPSLNSSQVAPFFSIVRNRNCNISQEAVDILNQVHSSLNDATQKEIYNNIMLLLQEPSAMHCYTNGSFYLFLKKYFNDFGFPDLTNFLLLMPIRQQPKLINSILESELEILLQQPNFVKNITDLCILLTNYKSISYLLENVNVPDFLRQQILFCVWPLALSSETQIDADAWFDNTLKDYLKFLTKDLISFPEIQTASCPSFWKLVSYLGEIYNYSNSDFTQNDVYSTIKDYLNSGTKPKCYDSTDPQMNSTAWFLNNLNTFISFMSLNDLISFVPTNDMGLFLVNPENIQLFSSQTLPVDVVSFCTSQIYKYSPNFDPLALPGQFLCDVPISVYMNQNQTQSISILNILNIFCNNSESAAALVENIQTVNVNTIVNLGQKNTALTVSQLSSTSVSVLVSSLQTLSNASGWSLDQTTTIIHAIMAGGYKIDSAASLVSLGSLISGVPSTIFDSIPTSVIISSSQNQNFINNMIQAPEIVQDVYVSKIITISQDPNKIIQYVPNALASKIPLPLLVLSEKNIQVTTVNAKAWDQEQAILLFGTVANATANVEVLAPSILQGFTCSGVSHLEVSKIIQLIQASRLRPGRNKVMLTETQLTCMNNYIQDVESLNFTEYPSDMLLYYNYSKVGQNQCQSYFIAIGAADFSIPSAVLGLDTTLLDEAKSCLGISGTSLSANNVEVLGNMVCTLNGSYIQNSDSLILEKLKNCNNFSMDQVTAMEDLLFTGATKYGNTSSWNLQTLYNLEPLPLYLTTQFWSMFVNSVKQQFLRSFLPQLRENGVDIQKLRNLFEMLNPVRSKRYAECNGSSITQIQINDQSFPFGFGLKDFNCMDVNLVTDNLATLATKVVATDLQNAILAKLNQAYPSGLPDGKVQLLGSISHVASLGDINKWNITTIDTLSALMNPSLGQWGPDMCKAIITKYLGTAGKSLGTLELNSIGGQNLCCLDVSILETINSSSLGYANPLDISSCTTQQKNLLYQKALTFFSIYKSKADAYYQLSRPYLGGAGLQDIRSLSVMNINMDILTFENLNTDVIMNLTVKEVQGLLGTSLPDLKTFKSVSILHQWIANQFQSDLNTLKIGLTGGKSASVPTAAPAGNSADSSTKSTAASTTKHASTAGNGIANPNNGGMHSAPTHWALTVLIGIIIISLQLLW
ncbi:uncharacterized protein LOC125742380 isoform X1 [Brienomyrus brachyistius]|uniref:uncharacterized protein LOC125742380 isoform X1 n=1 Tax=Brienomyrus brachyistius TaxID=42636 RepID=UPI0020B1CC14|nr:uncharacterized protein LOC125742380 isoform X1 [Brienomyrus brachyistius]